MVTMMGVREECIGVICPIHHKLFFLETVRQCKKHIIGTYSPGKPVGSIKFS